MKKALVTFGFGPHEELLGLSLPTFKKFASTHGYDLVVGKENELVGESEFRPYAWWKILILKKLVPDYDTLLWLDCDIMAIRYEEDFPHYKDILQTFVSHKTGAGNVVNTGVLGLNCRDKTLIRQYLDNIWKQSQYTNHGWWENAAVIHLLGINPNVKPLTINFKGEYAQRTKLIESRWNWITCDINRVNESQSIFLHTAGFNPSKSKELMKSWSCKYE